MHRVWIRVDFWRSRQEANTESSSVHVEFLRKVDSGLLAWCLLLLSLANSLFWMQTKTPVHAACLDSSRCWRSRPEALTVSCVNTATIEGTRFKVNRLLLSLANAVFVWGQTKLPKNASCLDSSRCWRSRPEAHASQSSCVIMQYRSCSGLT